MDESFDVVLANDASLYLFQTCVRVFGINILMLTCIYQHVTELLNTESGLTFSFVWKCFGEVSDLDAVVVCNIQNSIVACANNYGWKFISQSFRNNEHKCSSFRRTPSVIKLDLTIVAWLFIQMVWYSAMGLFVDVRTDDPRTVISSDKTHSFYHISSVQK